MRAPGLGQPFVESGFDTPIGPVPRVRRVLTSIDRAGHWRVRWSIGRDDFAVDPGLYALGTPNADSPVVVTANYKLTFDVVRSSLPGFDAWLLVLDTRGINVWCAAGKGTFGTDELVDRIQFSRLSRVVSHRRLIVPQLGATGVAGHMVRKLTSFSVVFGPVAIRDLPAFVSAGLRATAEMRRPTFTLRERLVLTPVELVGGLKPAGAVVAGLVVLAVLTTQPLTSAALALSVSRLVAPVVLALLGGAVVTPLLLPWLPPRMFAAKGAIVGAILAVATIIAMRPPVTGAIATLLAMVAIASFTAMNFTGSTPFTSLSGVEREMRRWIPLQAVAAALSLLTLLVGVFVR